MLCNHLYILVCINDCFYCKRIKEIILENFGNIYKITDVEGSSKNSSQVKSFLWKDFSFL